MNVQDILAYLQDVLVQIKNFLLQEPAVLLVAFALLMIGLLLLWKRSGYKGRIKVLQQKKELLENEKQEAEIAKILAEANYQDIFHQQKQLLEKYTVTHAQNESYTAEINELRPYKIRYKTAALNLEQAKKQIAHLEAHNHRIFEENKELSKSVVVEETVG